MKSIWLHKFTVEGFGIFPFDMLRYDSCYPETQEDVANISTVEVESGLLDRRKIKLVHKHQVQDWNPTFKRWQSFGWSVVSQYEYKSTWK